VRELHHTIEKAVILCDSDILMPEDFIISQSTQKASLNKKPPTFAEIEKQALQIALDNNNGSVLKASQELEIARQTMYNKMQKYKL